MTKEFLAEHSMEESATQFDTELKEFVDKVNTVNDMEELNKLEEENGKEYDEVNSYLRTVQYQLPAGVDFDGEHYSLKDVVTKIIYFINKQEVEWKYTLGLYQLVKFWKADNPTVIDYGVYDSTLRILNQVHFKGFQEWRDINVCNEYFRGNHESYSKDTSWLIFVSEKHNAILDRMTALQKVGNEVEQA